MNPSVQTRLIDARNMNTMLSSIDSPSHFQSTSFRGSLALMIAFLALVNPGIASSLLEEPLRERHEPVQEVDRQEKDQHECCRDGFSRFGKWVHPGERNHFPHYFFPVHLGIACESFVMSANNPTATNANATKSVRE